MSFDMKWIKAISVGLFMVTLAACEPAKLETSQPDARDDTGRNGGQPPANHTQYEFVSYDVLYSTLTVTLGVGQVNYPGTAGDPTDPPSPNNPRHDPIGFFVDRAVTAGMPIYDPNDPSASIPTNFSTLGMKNWLYAASGACGLAMAGPKGGEFFPQGDSNYDTIYLTLLGRSPSGKEVADLDATVAQFDSSAQKRAAVCTAILGSMEFLTEN